MVPFCLILGCGGKTRTGNKIMGGAAELLHISILNLQHSGRCIFIILLDVIMNQRLIKDLPVLYHFYQQNLN